MAQVASQPSLNRRRLALVPSSLDWLQGLMPALADAKMLNFHAVDDARSRGVERISIETGSMAFFEPARALYAKAGFVPCPPFGSYVDDPLSTFMTLEIRPR